MNADTINVVLEPLLRCQLAGSGVAQGGRSDPAEAISFTEVVDHHEPGIGRMHLAKGSVRALCRRYHLDRHQPPTGVANRELVFRLGNRRPLAPVLRLLPSQRRARQWHIVKRRDVDLVQLWRLSVGSVRPENPLWSWSGVPAMLKRYIDRVVSAGFAYVIKGKDYRPSLSGNKGATIMTSEASVEELKSSGRKFPAHRNCHSTQFGSPLPHMLDSGAQAWRRLITHSTGLLRRRKHSC